jgi:hypothetical protein
MKIKEGRKKHFKQKKSAFLVGLSSMKILIEKRREVNKSYKKSFAASSFLLV